MIEGQPSATAFRVAMRRAAHQLLDKPLIFEDPLALTIVGGDRGSVLARDELSRADSPGAFMKISLGSTSRRRTVSVAGSPKGTPCAIQL